MKLPLRRFRITQLAIELPNGTRLSPLTAIVSVPGLRPFFVLPRQSSIDELRKPLLSTAQCLEIRRSPC